MAHTNQDLDALRSGIAETVNRGDRFMIDTTATGGHRPLRLCTIDPRTTRGDIDALLTAAGRALA